MTTTTLLEKIQNDIRAYTGQLDSLIFLRKTGRIEEDRYQNEYIQAVNNRAKLIETEQTIKGYI
jgi:hypothetical protein